MTDTPTPAPTATRTPTATPFIWVTPTFYPTPDATLIAYPNTNPILVEAAEETVQVWHVANQNDLMDNAMTLVLIIAIFLALRDIRNRLMKADV